MKISNLSKTSRIWYIILILTLVILILPIKIPYSIKVPGKILPCKEWIVAKDMDGRIVTVLNDYRTGLSKNYTVTQFERGDVIQFYINEKLFLGCHIEKEDTIGLLYSNETERLYAQLMGEIAVAKASLAANISGEKSTMIEEEKERLLYMKRKAEEQKNLFKRMESLFRKDLISAEEYEIAKGNVALSDIDVSIAEAHLKTVQSGVKNEEIEYIRYQIKSLENQLGTLQSRFRGYKILSQISGTISKLQNGDTLLVVNDNCNYSVLLPITWEQNFLVKPNQNVYIKVPGSGVIKNAAFSSSEASVRLINRQQVLLHFASLNSGGNDVVPGLMVECSIQCDPVSPFTYLKRLFKLYD